MKNRGILVLSALALLAVAAAGFALWQTARHTAPDTASERKLFPDLAAKLGDLARIETKAGDTVTIIQKKGESWILPEKSNYPADRAKVAQLATILGNLTLLEEKTSDPARYADLGLGNPGKDKGAGRSIRLLDAAGKPLASVVIGRSAPSLGRIGGGVYVRREDDPATWLAEGLFDMPDTALGWADQSIFGLTDAKKIKSAVLTANGKPIVTLARNKPEDENLTMQPAPAKPDEGKITRLAAMPAALIFDDVKPLPDSQPKASRVAVFTGFDGTGYRLTLFPAGKETWVKADEQGGGDAIKAFNEAHAAWLYKLPDYRAGLLQGTPADFSLKQPDQAP